MNITERKRMEEALRGSEEKLRELKDMKDKFLHIIAHDLKNPFTTLIGLTGLMMDTINKMSADDIKHYLTMLNQSAKLFLKFLRKVFKNDPFPGAP